LDIDFLSEVLCNVSQPLQENVEVVPVIVPWPLHSMSFHYSPDLTNCSSR
jgi:hypothetical protein